jgi:phage gp36-like protein
MPYATPAELLVRYDARRVGDLVSDTGDRDTNPVASPVLAACLDDASGHIDSACRVGGRYSTTELDTMVGNGSSLLIRLTCDIAYGLLVARRGYSATDQQAMAPNYKPALDMLELIRKGERVFDIYNGGDPDEGSSVTATAKVMKARTAGYYIGNDMVGLSSRFFGRRNPN